MKPLKIAGVPEHFNAPWRYAVREQLFNFPVEFIEYPTGTGAMCQALSDGKVDVAIVLTEGILKHQEQNPSLKIIATYVETPLTWGIHITRQSAITDVSELKDKTFAISRHGSGSHLIVKLLAQNYGWDFDAMNFLAVGDIHQLGQALQEKIADVFLWEVFTTKPYLETHQLKLLDTLPTPWPCFQIVTAAEFYQNTTLINNLCDTIFSICQRFNQDHDFALNTIQEFYPLNSDDLKVWLQTVKWAEQKHVLKLIT